MNAVEAVVLNWRRPGNLPKVIQGLRKQMAPVTITLVDASEEKRFNVSSKVKKSVDRYHKLGFNLGGWNRFAACGLYDHEYTMFVDDDLVPAAPMSYHFLHCAKRLNDRFAVLGLEGRCFNENGTFNKTPVLRAGSAFIPVDVLVRIYFIRTALLPLVLNDSDLIHEKGHGCEDDIIAHTAIQRQTKLPAYLTPMVPPDPWPGTDWLSLSQNDAISQQIGIDSRLDAAVYSVIERGYRPVPSGYFLQA